MIDVTPEQKTIEAEEIIVTCDSKESVKTGDNMEEGALDPPSEAL